MWANNTYWLAKLIHQKLAEAGELIEDKSPYYNYTPANVLVNENFKLYWNRNILTEQTIHFNPYPANVEYRVSS